MGSARTATPHLFSAVITVAVAATILFAGRVAVIHLERRTLAWTAPRYNFTPIEFEDHDEDPAFLDAQHTHLTQEGWRFYNRALDDFFHGRVPGS